MLIVYSCHGLFKSYNVLKLTAIKKQPKCNIFGLTGALLGVMCWKLKYGSCVYFYTVLKCLTCVFLSINFRAFAAVETVESMYALRHGSHVTPLSIQETLDCSYAYGRILYSCYGGDTCIAFDWMNTVCVMALFYRDGLRYLHLATSEM